MKKPKHPRFPKCFLCGKRCEQTDRNNDGTYAHEDCLRGNQTYPHLRTK